MEGMLPPLVAFLLADIGEFKLKMAEAGAIAAATTTGTASKFQRLAQVGKVAMIATAAVIGLVAGAAFELEKHAEEAGQAAFEMSEKFGLSGKQASLWTQIGARIGVSAGQVSGAFRFLTRNMENVNLAMKAHAPSARSLMEAHEKMRLATEHYNAAMAKTVPGSQQAQAATLAYQRAQDSFQKTMQAATGKLSPVGQAFKTLGINIFDTHGKLRSANDVMRDAVIAFGKMPAGVEKAGLAMKLFGRSGQNLLPLLNQGKIGLDQLTAAALKSGAVMSTEQVDSAHQAFLAHKAFDQAIAGVVTQLSVGLLPVATKVFTFMTATAIPAIQNAVNWTKSHTEVIKIVAAAIAGPLLLAIGAYTYSMGAAAVATIAATWPILVIIGALMALGVAIYMVYTHWSQITTFLKAAWSTTVRVVSGLFDQLSTKIRTFVSTVVETFGDAWKDFASRPGYWVGVLLVQIPLQLYLLDRKIGAWIVGVYGRFQEGFRGVRDVALSELSKLAPGLWSQLLDALAQVARWQEMMSAAAGRVALAFVNSVIDGMISLPQQLHEVGMKLPQGIIAGVLSQQGAVTSAFNGLFSDIQTSGDATSKSLGTSFGSAISTVNGKFSDFGKSAGKNTLSGLASFATPVSKMMTDLPGQLDTQLALVVTNAGTWADQMYAAGTKGGKDFVTSVGSALKALPGQFAAAITGAFSTGVGQIADGASRLGGALQSAIAPLVTSADGLWQEFSTRPLYWITRMVLAVPLSLVALGSRITLWLAKIVSDGSKGFADFVTEGIRPLSSFPGQVAPWLARTQAQAFAWATHLAQAGTQGGSDFVTSVITELNNLPLQFSAAIVTAFSAAVAQVKGGFATLVTSLRTAAAPLAAAADNAWEQFSARPIYWITRMVLAVPLALVALGNRISTWLAGLAIRAETGFAGFVRAGVQTISQLPGRITSWLVQTQARVLSWAGGFAKSSVSAGRSFVASLIAQLKALPGQIVASLGSSFSTIVATVGGLFSQLGTAVQGALRPVVGKAEAVWKEFSSRPVYWITRMVLAIPLALVALVVGIDFWLAGLATKAGVGFRAFVGNAVKAITPLPGRLLAFLIATGVGIARWAVGVGAQAISTGQKFVQGVISGIQSLPRLIGQALGFVIGLVVQWATQLGSWSQKTGSDFVNAVVAEVKALPHQLLALLNTIVTNVSKWAGQLKTWAVNTGTNFVANLIARVRALPSQLGTWLKTTLSNIVTWGKNLVGSGKTSADNFATAIVKVFTNLPATLKTIGGNLIQGLINGMLSLKKLVADSLSQIIQGAIDQAKAAFGIHSPSSVVTKKIGTPIGQSIPAGILGQSVNAAKAMKSLIGSAVGAGGMVGVATGVVGGAVGGAGSSGGYEVARAGASTARGGNTTLQNELLARVANAVEGLLRIGKGITVNVYADDAEEAGDDVTAALRRLVAT